MKLKKNCEHRVCAGPSCGDLLLPITFNRVFGLEIFVVVAQQVETDSVVEDVRVGETRLDLHLRRFERIVLRKLEFEVEDASRVRRVSPGNQIGVPWKVEIVLINEFKNNIIL